MKSQMTPTMKPKHNIQRDVIEAALKADAAAAEQYNAYIDDAGFTLRVMDALPALPTSTSMRTTLSSTKRFSIIFGLAMIAAIIATVFLSGDNLLIDASMDVATDTITPSVIALITIMLVTTAVSVSAVLGRR